MNFGFQIESFSEKCFKKEVVVAIHKMVDRKIPLLRRGGVNQGSRMSARTAEGP